MWLLTPLIPRVRLNVANVPHYQREGERTGMVELQKTVKNTTAKGDIAEQAVVLALLKAGKTVLRPISNGLRYDLVVDNFDGTFTRVQGKLAR